MKVQKGSVYPQLTAETIFYLSMRLLSFDSNIFYILILLFIYTRYLLFIYTHLFTYPLTSYLLVGSLHVIKIFLLYYLSEV